MLLTAAALSVLTPPLLPLFDPLFDPQKARAGSDGMGRAAAAGTGLLANVVAGVGSAIGATRTGAEEEHFVGGSGSSGGGSGSGGGTGGRGDGTAPLVQLYRRPDADKPQGRTGGTAGAATTRTNFSTGFSSDSNTGDVVTSGNYSTCVLPELERAEVAPGHNGNSKISSRNEFTVDTVDAAGEDGGMERRSALGVASATGGAVLRGLWGGVQSAASGVAVATRQGDSGGGGVSGGREPQPPSEFRLYRREGDT